MRITHDPSADAAYIYLKEIEPGEAAIHVPVEDDFSVGEFILDLDPDGRLLGIEILCPGHRLPEEVLRQAERR